MKVLVTGGAGYIGSHVVKQLGEAGHDIVVYDNLSTGYEWAVTYGELIVGDLADVEKLESVFADHDFEAVLHFAAHIIVPESVENPIKYYSNNTRNTLNLLSVIEKFKTPYMVFSSTAAVYGMPEQKVVTEDMPLSPINPYGASKLMSEQMIRDLSNASNLKHVILRYFNVAGADVQSRIGQATPGSTNLIKVACECARGVRPSMKVFGTDYETRDGTGIRDYIHVDDLAKAHVMALDYMAKGGESEVLNCGYGRGFTVKEVIKVVREKSGVDFVAEEVGRRAGDPDSMTSDNTKIKELLKWVPDFDDLNVIVESALNWEQKWQAQKKD